MSHSGCNLCAGEQALEVWGDLGDYCSVWAIFCASGEEEIWEVACGEGGMTKFRRHEQQKEMCGLGLQLKENIELLHMDTPEFS